MVKIVFESHGTSVDNEANLSSGWNDVELSELGEKQAKGLGNRYDGEHFDAIFCSDLQRSYKTAEIAFADKYTIIKDKRLRECNYGDLTKHPSEEVEAEKLNRIQIPFPNGESYEQISQRMKNFLDYLKENYNGKKVIIIGHRATQYGLDHWIKGKSLKDLVKSSFKWQPGWTYVWE